MHRALRNGLEAAGLVAALGFVFVMAYVPHLDTFMGAPSGEYPNVMRVAEAARESVVGERRGYPYPLHVDENLHWVLIASTQRQDRVFLDSPWDGTPADSDRLLSLRGAVHEVGFRVALAEVQELTGVPFVHLFRFLPAAWLTFTAFGLYAALRPHPVSIPAAFFVGLVPTTVRFLGPSFLVPIGFSLAWLPAVVILAEPAKRRADAAFLLLMVVAWAFFVHLIGGFAAVSLLAFAALFSVGRERRSAFVLLLLALLPVLWLYRAFTADVQGELDREEGLPIDFTIFDHFGVPALFLWGGGVLSLLVWPPKRSAIPVASFAALSVLALSLILGGIVLDLDKYATYARWHPPFFTAAAVPLAYAVVVASRGIGWAAGNLLDQWPKIARNAIPAITLVAGLVLAPAVAGQGIGYHMREPYYHVIDDADWAAYTQVALVAGPEYEVFLTHPWKAPVLVALTGMYPHAWLMPGTPPNRGEDYEMYASTGGTMAFFIDNDITLVATRGKPPYEEFVPLAGDSWAMRPDLARQIAEIRALERPAG